MRERKKVWSSFLTEKRTRVKLHPCGECAIRRLTSERGFCVWKKAARQFFAKQWQRSIKSKRDKKQSRWKIRLVQCPAMCCTINCCRFWGREKQERERERVIRDVNYEKWPCGKRECLSCIIVASVHMFRVICWETFAAGNFAEARASAFFRNGKTYISRKFLSKTSRISKISRD